MAEDAEVSNISGNNCKDETFERLLLTSKKSNRATGYLTPEARLAFTQLRKAFTKALIFQHFNPKYHIRIETDTWGYAIGGILSQLTLDDLGQWHQVAYYLQKMIPAKTRYKTHNKELLAIVEALKTWGHYLEGSNYEVLVLTDHNNLRQFMDTKSLSSSQIRWA